jgi:ATP-dependent Clp protease protease subunit
MKEIELMSKRKERVLVLGEDVDQDSATDIIKAIYEYNLIDEEGMATYSEYERKPIHLLINTYGGSVYDGLGIIGAIELSGTPVIGTCMGSAMSMGLFILASCHYRRASSLSTIMYHQISTGMWDKLEGIRKDLDESERLQTLCDNILFRKTKMKASDLDFHKSKKSEWYITPKTAKSLGIIDEILGSVEPELPVKPKATKTTAKNVKETKPTKEVKPTEKPVKSPRKKKEIKK